MKNSIPKLSCICHLIPREAHVELLKLAKHYKAVALVGPRHSGKTTLVRQVFGNKPYVNLENPDVRICAGRPQRVFGPI